MFSSTTAKMVIIVLGIMTLTATGVITVTSLSAERTLYEQRRNEARNILRLVMLDVEHQYDSLVRFKIDAVAWRRRHLQDAVTSAMLVLEGHYRDQARGLLTPAEAQARAREWLMEFRFGGEARCLAFDRDRQGLVHPDARFIGRQWDDFVDIKGNNALTEAISAVKERRDFFSVMSWPDPASGYRRRHLAYFRRFVPWDWVVAASVPIDDLEMEAGRKQREIIGRLGRTFTDIILTRRGSLFLFNGQEELLAYPARSDSEADWPLRRLTGRRLLAELSATARDSSAPKEFTWSEISEGKNPDEWVAFVDRFKALDWYVAYSLSREELEAPARELAARQLLVVLSIFLLGFMLLYVLISRTIRPVVLLTRRVENLSGDEFNYSAEADAELDLLARDRTDEVAKLARAFRTMQTALQEYLANLTEAKSRLEREIGERILIEAALRASEDHLASLMRTAEGFAVFRLRYSPGKTTFFEVVFVSPSIHELLGITDASTLDKWVQPVHSEDRQAIWDAMNRMFTTFRFNEICRVQHPSTGENLWIQAIATGLPDHQGRMEYINGMILDITARKRVEQKLVEHQNRLRELGSELILAEERERRLIATELHDGIGQSLIFCKIKLEALKNDVTEPAWRGRVEYLARVMDEMITLTRSLTMDLSPPILYELGLDAALEWLTEQFYTRHDLEVSFWEDSQNRPISDDLKVFLFRATRELLTNVVKHARADHAWINVQRLEGWIQVSVEDNGQGFDPLALEGESGAYTGFGLFSIRERLESMGGEFHIEAAPGRGARATLAAPLIGFEGQPPPRLEEEPEPED